MKQQMQHLLTAIGIAVSANFSHAQDHGHLNVGATGTGQDAPLIFDNGAIFATSYNYVYTLNYTNGSRYAGYYQGNITLTALAATAAYAGPVPNAPALGSQIYAQLVSVDGPPGGVFGFWDAGATNPTIAVLTGTTSTNVWLLSENDDSPSSDPYGHIHGRRFTATLPGVYTVGFRALDWSTNGVGGGPIHKPSGVLRIYFQAGVNIKRIEPDLDHPHVQFSAPVGRSWVVEASDSMAPDATWTAISAPLDGDDLFHEVTDARAAEGRRFFRMKSALP
jgi:hypothetical protein